MSRLRRVCLKTVFVSQKYFHRPHYKGDPFGLVSPSVNSTICIEVRGKSEESEIQTLFSY